MRPGASYVVVLIVALTGCADLLGLDDGRLPEGGGGQSDGGGMGGGGSGVGAGGAGGANGGMGGAGGAGGAGGHGGEGGTAVCDSIAESSNFNTNSLDGFLESLGMGAVILGGTLRIQFDTTFPNQFLTVAYRAPVSIVNRCASIKIIGVDVPNMNAEFGIYRGAVSDSFRFRVRGTELRFVDVENNVVVDSLGSLTFDLSQHTYWRFRHDGTTNRLFWEVSDVDGPWIEVADKVIADAAEVRPFISLNSANAGLSGFFQVDDLNLPP